MASSPDIRPLSPLPVPAAENKVGSATALENGRGRTSAQVPADMEALGRDMPAVFSSVWAEVGFCFSVLMSVWVAEFFISGFHTILPPISDALDIPDRAQTWPASVFSLVTGALLLPAARVADLVGPRIPFALGLAWFAAAAVAAGFSTSYAMLVTTRALQAVGAAAFSPAAVTMLGRAYRPGPRKNLVFGLYGAFAPLGFFFGILLGGVAAQRLNWRWYFWIGAAIAGVVAVAATATVPTGLRSFGGDGPGHGPRGMDWWGAATLVPGLILFVFALTDGSFGQPVVIIALVLGVLLLGAGVYVEGWVAEEPLLRPGLFRVRNMRAMTVALWLTYGAFGMYLFYATFYLEEVLGISPLETALYFAPMAGGGVILSGLGGLVLHRIPGTALLLVSAVSMATSALLLALQPASTTSYWPFIFPAMVCATIGSDITWTVGNVFITTSLLDRDQAVAGALIHSLLFLGIGFWLGLTNLVVSTAAAARLLSRRDAYRVAFWVGFAVGLVAVAVFATVRIGRARSDLTADERERLEEERAGPDEDGGEVDEEGREDGRSDST